MAYTDSDLPYLMALSSVPHIGPVTQRLLLQHFGTAEAILSASDKQWRACSGLSRAQREALKSKQNLEQAIKTLRQLEEWQIQVLDYRSPDYPKRLLEISSFPLLIYARGNVQACHHPKLLSVVGTRRMTDYGKKALESLIAPLAQAGLGIVSGMAYGVDGYAHRLSLAAHGVAIAVQAQGVEKGHPSGHQDLYSDLIHQGGLVISEFPFLSNDQVHKGLFPRRNRLISGLSDGLLVVEADERSGSLITARYGLEQNRSVFAMPGDFDRRYSRGCAKLIREGAQLVTSPEHILEELNSLICVSNKLDHTVMQKENSISLDLFETSLEKEVYQICREARSLDEIIEQASETASFVSATVTKMQLLGRLKDIGGTRFVAQ